VGDEYSLSTKMSSNASEMSSADKLQELTKLQADFEKEWYAAGGGTLRSPSYGGTSTTFYLGEMLESINTLRKELGLDEYSPPTFVPCLTPERPSKTESIPPPPPLRRVNAFTTSVAATQDPTDEDDLMDRLRIYRAELQLKQDDLYKGASTDEEIATLNEQYDEINRKIHAIENLMLTCGAIFRTR